MVTRNVKIRWILENCVNESGSIDLRDLDFSDFEGDVLLNGMKTKRKLDISQCTVGGDLYQSHQKVGRDLFQNHQIAERDLWQFEQSVGGSIRQYSQTAKEKIYTHKPVNGEVVVEQGYFLEIQMLKEVTEEELRKLGYILKKES